MPNFNLSEQAMRLGATHYRIRYYETRISPNGKNPVAPFAYYFFDENDEEIAYYIVDLVSYGLVVRDKPIVWGYFFKYHDLTSQIHFI
jgi:hypothetical protein